MLYCCLGTAGTQRVGLVLQCCQEAFDQQHVDVFLSPADAAAEEEACARLKALPQVAVHQADHLPACAELHEGDHKAHEFWLAGGVEDPRPFLLALKQRLLKTSQQLGCILTVVDCRLAERVENALLWYNVCGHFSDSMLLDHRAEGSKRWIQEYQKRLMRALHPTRVLLMKRGGRVDRPLELLIPEARRQSHVFDIDSDAMLAQSLIDAVEGTDNLDEAERPIDDPQDDLYLQRMDTGGWRKPLPSVADLLAMLDT